VRKVTIRLLLLLLGLSSLQQAVAQQLEAEAQVQQMYIAYYGRPGDPAGVEYWAGQLASSGGDLSAIIDAFGNSAEYTQRFGSLSSEELVNNIYQQLFGRDADAAGLAFYVESLDSGERSLASIALDIAAGVPPGSDDEVIVSNKLEVASLFTYAVEELKAPYGLEQVDPARNLLSGVGAAENSLNTALDAVFPLVTSFGGDGNAAAYLYFVDNISDLIIQQSCIACHVSGGLAQGTRLVYVGADDPDYHAINFAEWEALAGEQENLTGYALSKATGVNHGGGQQLVPGSDDYLAMEKFLELLTDSGNSPAPGALFEGYGMADPAATLRRAAVIVGGTLPDEALLQSVTEGGEAALRSALRSLMQGDGFHRFLVEGANDRLLTDSFISEPPTRFLRTPYYPDLANYAASLTESDRNSMQVQALVRGVSWGIARQPTELIAYVVEQDRPYTEILTADYTVVNPQLALAYRSPVEFADDGDIDQWQVSTVEGYTRIDSSTSYERGEYLGAYVSGGLATDYPQAGVLNTPGWLARYPSTDTNRNRARARWTWYHFLGFDIEKSAPRTTDPDALADTDNPTLKNPNCTICHEIMDPVAGAYQNYGDGGFYKNQPGGLDSLPRLYKRERGTEDPYQPGDVWYRDMLGPGFDGLEYMNTEDTLRSLSADIALDPRFASGTVKFWWPAVMGEEAAVAPEDPADVDYQQRLALFQAQSGDIAGLSQGFAAGFDGGAAYNLRDLLVEMLMSPWFRVDRRQGEPTAPDGALADVGTARLLTPEQLDRKTEQVTGFRWYEQERFGIETSQLDGAYRLIYGGIDSDAVTVRATEMTALMSTVVEAQPLQMACALVGLEFNRPVDSRRIFTEVTRAQHEGNAEAAIRTQLQKIHADFLGESLAANDPEIDAALSLFTETRSERFTQGYPAALNGSSDEACPFHLLPGTAGWDLADPQHVMNTWISMLIYFMTDFRYVYE
jgi:hypothetical protein